MTRYAWQALLDATGLDDTTVKARLGLDRRQVARYRQDGLTEVRADELAARCGFHPCNVWPEMTDQLIAEHSVECAERSCDIRFVPSRKGHKFCSARCRHRTNERIAREANLPSAVRKRIRRRMYYQLYGDYERARQRRYDQAKRSAA